MNRFLSSSTFQMSSIVIHDKCFRDSLTLKEMMDYQYNLKRMKIISNDKVFCFYSKGTKNDEKVDNFFCLPRVLKSSNVSSFFSKNFHTLKMMVERKHEEPITIVIDERSIFNVRWFFNKEVVNDFLFDGSRDAISFLTSISVNSNITLILNPSLFELDNITKRILFSGLHVADLDYSIYHILKKHGIAPQTPQCEKFLNELDMKIKDLNQQSKESEAVVHFFSNNPKILPHPSESFLSNVLVVKPLSNIVFQYLDQHPIIDIITSFFLSFIEL